MASIQIPARLQPESLDHPTLSAHLDDEFRQYTERHQAVVIDFAKMDTLNSAGAGRLVGWLRHAAAHNVKVSATNVAPSLRALLDLTSLTPVLPTTTSTPRRAS